MLKLLPVGLVILGMVGISSYIAFFRPPQTSENSTTSETSSVKPNASPAFTPSSSPKPVPTAAPISTPSPTTSSPLQSQIDSLKKDISDLKAQLTQQQAQLASTQNQTSQTTQTLTSKVPVYIPLGWVGSGTSLDFATLTTQELAIDSNDYSGYKNMQLEVNLRVYQGNGKAFARLYNNIDFTAVNGSEVATTSSDYTWVSSSTFSLPSGKKTYRIQLKSLTGYSADVQNARLKVNF